MKATKKLGNSKNCHLVICSATLVMKQQKHVIDNVIFGLNKYRYVTVSFKLRF